MSDNIGDFNMAFVWDSKSRSVIDQDSDFSMKETDLRPGEREFAVHGNGVTVSIYASSIYEDKYSEELNSYVWKFKIASSSDLIWKVIGSTSRDVLVGKIESALNIYLMHGNPKDTRSAIVVFGA